MASEDDDLDDLDDLDDVLGETPPPRRRRRSGQTAPVAKTPPGPRAVKAPNIIEDDPDLEHLADGALPDPSEFHRPCRVTFLATVFGTEPRRLHKKLTHCPVIGWESHSGRRVPVYDFKVAVQYIVDPKLDIATWIRTQQPHTLPVMINKAFWDAELQRLRWMERARHYWHDSDVLDALGRTAMAIKESAQLWIENMPGKAGMSTEQYAALQANVGELLDDIHQRLVEMPKLRKTESVARALDAVEAEQNEELLKGEM